MSIRENTKGQKKMNNGKYNHLRRRKTHKEILVVLGKWPRPEEFREPVKTKRNRETWRKLDREMDMWSREGKTPQKTLNKWQELENPELRETDSII